jgi:hypothetical protein
MLNITFALPSYALAGRHILIVEWYNRTDENRCLLKLGLNRPERIFLFYNGYDRVCLPVYTKADIKNNCLYCLKKESTCPSLSPM